MPEHLTEHMNPELVSPVVAYLCHEDTPDNGIIVEAGCGWFAKVRLQRAKGASHDFTKNGLSIEDVAAKWDVASDYSKSVYPGWDFKTNKKGSPKDGAIGNLIKLGLVKVKAPKKPAKM